MMLEPGQIFAGRYQVIRLIAPGGMGAVFEAEHTGTERRVALKLLWPHVLAVQSAREKFEFEAKVAARVQSEHIVHVLDAGFDEPTRSPYLVMELLPGGTLAELVEQEQRLSPELTVQLLQQVAKGLDAAHTLRDSKGALTPIIHRDLKPENLLLVLRESAPPAVKILDFGIAKLLSESRNMSHEIRGTPMYMAYEQVSAEKLSPQTDIWALGLIAYFMLTGRRYWKSANDPEATMQALFMEIVMAPMVPARQRLAEQGADFTLPEAFDAWLERCIDRVPANRFESASAAIIALEAALRVKLTGAAQTAPVVPQLRPPSASAPRSMTVSVGHGRVGAGSVGAGSVAAVGRVAAAGRVGAGRVAAGSVAAVSAGAASTVREPLASTAASVPGLESRPLTATRQPSPRSRTRPLLVVGALAATLALGGSALWWTRSAPSSGVNVGIDTLLPPPADAPAAAASRAPGSQLAAERRAPVPAELGTSPRTESAAALLPKVPQAQSPEAAAATPQIAPVEPLIAPIASPVTQAAPAAPQVAPAAAAAQAPPAPKFQLPPLPDDLMRPGSSEPAASVARAPAVATRKAAPVKAAPVKAAPAKPAPAAAKPAPSAVQRVPREPEKPRSDPNALPLNPFDLH